MRSVLVGGNTDPARTDGISTAEANPDAMVHTPGADPDIVEYGRPVQARVARVGPTRCQTPAVATRAVGGLFGFDLLAVDAGLAGSTVTDPGFDGVSQPAMDPYVAGEAKGGVGTGGTLSLAAAAGVSVAALHERTATVYDRLVCEEVTATA